MSSAANGKIHLTIDGRKVSAEPGVMLIEAARQAGIDIPYYCYDPDLTIVASCRLCLVEIEKVPKLVPSCSTPVDEGQVVYTQSEKVLDARKMQMEFLLVQHPLDCPVCDQGGECKLQDYSRKYGTDDSRFRFPKRTFPKPDLGPFIDIERNRCILCSRCVRFMDEIAGNAELAIVERGNRAYISTFLDKPLVNEFAGNTIDLCPVGALTSKVTRFRGRVWEFASTPSIASLSSCGSNLYLQRRERTHEIMRILPRENGEVNHRWISDIERFGFDRFNSPHRQRSPKVKNEKDEWEEISWGKAVSRIVATLKETIQSHGNGAVAGIIAPRQSNETLFLFQQFLRELAGTNHIDHRTEHELSENDDGFLTSFALGAANQPFQEIQEAETILLVGSDLPNENPILHLRARTQTKRGATLYSAHSRTTRLDKDCARTLLYRPGSDSYFLWGLLTAVRQAKEIDSTADFAVITQETGIAENDYRTLAKVLCESKRAAILLGETAFALAGGSETVRIAAELAKLLQTENQNILPMSLLLPHFNSRGAADMGCYPHRGPGYAPIPSPGKNTTQILEACAEGSIKALLLFNTDILNEYPNRRLVQKALDAVPFLLAADAFHYQTADCADIFLPLSVYTEEDGTYTNLAGRVQRAQLALPQLEGTLSGMQVLLALGEKWGSGWKQVRAPKIFEMAAKAASPYQGLTWDGLGEQGKIAKPTVPAMFKDSSAVQLGVPSAKAHPPQEYPLRWMRGRFLFDTDGDKRFAPPLVKRAEPCAANLHPADAQRLGIAEGDKIKIIGEIGEIELPARISTAALPGAISVLGRYDGLALNGIASEKSPWVKVRI
ncbi:MAG: NADH-quinone oxidoreductase subunit NuoG [Candidatus Omnitrophota bacterium]